MNNSPSTEIESLGCVPLGKTALAVGFLGVPSAVNHRIVQKLVLHLAKLVRDTDDGEPMALEAEIPAYGVDIISGRDWAKWREGLKATYGEPVLPVVAKD